MPNKRIVSRIRKARRGSITTADIAETLPMDRWTVSPEYLRSLYGDEVAETYVRLRDEEIKRDLAETPSVMAADATR